MGNLYNLVFGQNPISKVLLAMLGLTEGSCGRFRDCFISDGMIAVYTRNGGGNRECWHEDGDGYKACKHESREEIVDETYEATEEEIKAHPEWKLANVFIGSKRMVYTGKKVPETFYKCLAPNSKDCACPGCTIEYRLPAHPLYVRDEDDDFDSTYATIYFKFPEQYADDLSKLDSGEKFDPSQRWIDFLDGLKVKEAAP